MNIEEAKVAKREAEEAIKKALQDFMDRSGLKVNSVDVQVGGFGMLCQSEARYHVAAVKLDVAL